MKTKKFDCVDMMHRGAEFVRQRVEGMTIEEEAQYWLLRTKELRKQQRDLRRKAS